MKFEVVMCILDAIGLNVVPFDVIQYYILSGHHANLQTSDIVDTNQAWLSVPSINSKVMQVQACSNAHIYLTANPHIHFTNAFEIILQV